jgi:hypothetical protein
LITAFGLAATGRAPAAEEPVRRSSARIDNALIVAWPDQLPAAFAAGLPR